jgi:hypothetical protein
MRFSTLGLFRPWHIAWDHGPALCRIARDLTYWFISRRIRYDIRKYFSTLIRDLDGIV